MARDNRLMQSLLEVLYPTFFTLAYAVSQAQSVVVTPYLFFEVLQGPEALQRNRPYYLRQ